MHSQNRPSEQMSDQTFNDTCDFIVKLGATALGYGVSSFRLESHLNRVTAALGLRGDFLVTPEKIDSVLWREGDEAQRISIARAPAGFNMAGLAHVEELVLQVESGGVSVEVGTARLEEIEKTAPPFGPAHDRRLLRPHQCGFRGACCLCPGHERHHRDRTRRGHIRRRVPAGTLATSGQDDQSARGVRRFDSGVRDRDAIGARQQVHDGHALCRHRPDPKPGTGPGGR